MDKFYEQFLTTSQSGTYKLLKNLTYASIALAVIYFIASVITLNVSVFIFAVISIAVAFLMSRLRDKQYKEYEYIFTNGNLQIDVIYNQKKRKTVFDCDVKNFLDFGKEGEVKIPQGIKTVELFPWDNKNEKYVIIYEDKGKMAAYITPDEETLKLIKIYNVRGIR